MQQTDLDFSRQERDAGMAEALNHAESVSFGWADMAYDLMGSWCELLESTATFTSYDFIDNFQGMGHIMPPTPKAFGSIFTKAARNGLIRKVGYRPHPLRHASPTVLWEVV